MLSIQRNREAFLFGNTSGCGPGDWGEGLDLHNINDVPNVAFFTVRLYVLTSFHLLYPNTNSRLDLQMGHFLQLSSTVMFHDF